MHTFAGAQRGSVLADNPFGLAGLPDRDIQVAAINLDRCGAVEIRGI
jgi:hypothetical protein